jgi:hypothetical protein
LGIVYRHHGNLREAGEVLAAPERKFENVHVMSNLERSSTIKGGSRSRGISPASWKVEPNPPKLFN